jgi:hypothetical protein
MSESNIIPDLLHDAVLTNLEWRRDVAKMQLAFACLRRNSEGSPLEDPVELVLEGVTGIAVYYAPAAIEEKPSRFEVTEELTEADLGVWSDQVIPLYINSKVEGFEMRTASCVNWIVGESTESSPLDICIVKETFSSRSRGVRTGLLIQCANLQAMSGYLPLGIDEWAEQFDAWWHGWKKHWAEKEEGEAPVREDAFIPAGEDDPPDLSYRPPNKHPFVIGETDAPPELLNPIRRFHEGHHSQDWFEMARTHPNLEVPPDQCARQFQEQYQSYEFGTWCYIRTVDSWWQEEGRACVVVRGVEHSMPDEEDPATNSETVITYGLRKLEDDWIIWTWSQGWPRYGSAPKSLETESWRNEWELGE